MIKLNHAILIANRQHTLTMKHMLFSYKTQGKNKCILLLTEFGKITKNNRNFNKNYINKILKSHHQYELTLSCI